MLVDVSIPALVALLFKVILIAYAVRSPTKTLLTRLLLALLVVLAILNVVEVVLLNGYARLGLTPMVEGSGYAYAALLMISAPLLLHLSIALSFEETRAPKHKSVLLIYAPIFGLLYLLFFSDKLIPRFEPFMSYSILRVPGPWYFIVESLGTLYFSTTLLILLYGARSSRAALLRIRNRLWLLGLAPMLLFLLHIVIVDYLAGNRLSAPVHLPMVMTFFLLITTYATHERPRPGGFYRFLQCLFDLESYLPWSRSYSRRRALHARLRGIIAEIKSMGSVKDVVREIADALECPVALFGNQSQPLAQAGDAAKVVRFPRDRLQAIDRRIFSQHIARTMPDLHRLMARHRVAAIVPFHPHTRAAGWMLLGEKFTDKVYSPSDFQLIEAVFDRIAAHFLNEQVRLGEELAEMRPKMHVLRRQIAAAERRLQAMQRRLKVAARRNAAPSRRFGDEDLSDIQSRLLHQAARGKRTLDECIAAIEARLIAEALDRAGGNQAKAANLLGLRPNTLHYKIQRYGLQERRRGG